MLDLQHRTTAVKATVSASSVRQNSFTAVRTSAPLRLAQAIMGAALVLYSF